MSHRLINCPSCYGGTGNVRSYKCGFCRGKKKVNSYYVRWLKKRKKFEEKTEMGLKAVFKATLQLRMSDWDKKNKAPKKF